MSRKTHAPFIALLLLVLLVPADLSANSDLRASLSGVPETAPLGVTIEWTATFTNPSAEDRNDVYMTASIGNDRCVDLRIRLLAGETRTFRCTTRLPQAGPPYGVYASASISAFDHIEADPSNNQVSQFLRFLTKPDLRVFFHADQPLYPGLPFTVEVMYLKRRRHPGYLPRPLRGQCRHRKGGAALHRRGG